MIDQKHERGAMEIHYSAGGRSSHRRWVWLVGGLAVIAAVAASLVMVLSGGANNPTRAHDAVSASGHSRSPYALNNDPPPSLAGAYSDNLKTAFLALSAYGDWLLSHPSTLLVANVAEPGSPAYDTLLYNVTYLLKLGGHVQKDPRGYGGDVQYVKVTTPPRPILGPGGKQEEVDRHPAYTGGTVTVVSHFLASGIYSHSGKYLQPSQVRSGYLVGAVSLVQGVSGQWLLYEIKALNPSGGPRSVEK